MNIFFDLINDYTLRNIALGSAILGVTGGVIGSFTMLRKQSLLGDALSHAALPGVCMAFMATSKKGVELLIGAGLTAWIATLFILMVIRYTKIKEDAALGTVLASFFGIGLAMLTYIQNNYSSNQAGLDKFLFGQAAAIVESDVVTMSILGVVSVATIICFFKEFKLISFDPDFANTIGLPVGLLGTLVTSLAVVAVVIGLKVVGVVLMASMLIAPPAAARQWTDNLGKMLLLSAIFGAVSGVGGAMISALESNLPTGPFIVIIASVILLFSLGFAPNRGLIWEKIKSDKQKREFNKLLKQERSSI